jgi:hypothetical protein
MLLPVLLGYEQGIIIELHALSMKVQADFSDPFLNLSAEVGSPAFAKFKGSP